MLFTSASHTHVSNKALGYDLTMYEKSLVDRNFSGSFSSYGTTFRYVFIID